MQAEHALSDGHRQRGRGKRTCSQVDKIAAVAHEGVQVALRMLGDVPVVEAGHMLLYLLLYHTLQRCTAQACVESCTLCRSFRSVRSLRSSRSYMPIRQAPISLEGQ